jgi:hypothetical protein
MAMPFLGRGRRHALWGLPVAIAGVTIVFDPEHAPIWLALALLGMVRPWLIAWKAAQGTALRGALAWAALAIGLGLLAQVQGCMELSESGRPMTGRLTYVMVLTVLAGLVSVLGARRPGGGAWAILMLLLVVVLLIPWLEVGGRLRPHGLAGFQFDSPWTLFYGLLVLAGVTNYLPTRYGPAAAVLGGGLVLEYLGLTRPDWAAATRAAIWLGVAWSLALAGWLAAGSGESKPAARSDLERSWLWFRDHWGVVWALRIQERFNRSADLAQWPIRLTWFGVTRVSSSGVEASEELFASALATLRGLIRRFVAPERLDTVLSCYRGQSCHSQGPAR